MLDFLIQYKELLTLALAVVVQLVLFLVFKRRPKVIDNSIVTKLCIWILNAETKFRHGKDKLAFVLDEAKKYLGDDYVESDVKKLVEYILTIPQKKEK